MGSTASHALETEVADRLAEAAGGIFHTDVAFPPMTPLNGPGPEALTLNALPTVDLRSTRATMARSAATLLPQISHHMAPELRPAEPLLADQILTASVRLPVERLQQPDAFHGWLARQVGQVLEARCKLHAPMALDFTDVDHQVRQFQQSGKTDGLSCFLKTDDRNRHLCLAFWRDGMQVAESPLLKLSRIPHGEVLIELKELGPTRERDINSLAAHKNGSLATRAGRITYPSHLGDKISQAKPLAGLPTWQRLSVAGHGTPAEAHLGGVSGVADTVGDLTPRELCKKLQSMGLSTDHRGELHLFACNAATSMGGKPSYLERLREELAKCGYRHLSLSGPPGITGARGRVGGTVCTSELPPQEWQYLPQTLSDSQRRQAQLAQRIQTYQTMAQAKDDEGQFVLKDGERERVMEDLKMAALALQKETNYHAQLVKDVVPLRRSIQHTLLEERFAPVDVALGLIRYQGLSVRMGPKPR